MAGSERLRAVAGVVALGTQLVACTFGGVGNYDVAVCAQPVGASTTVEAVGMVTDLTFSSLSGHDTIGAFVAPATGGTCVEGIAATGFLNMGCSFLADELTLVPRQPMIVPLSAGHAAALVTTTAPCTMGALTYRLENQSVVGKVDIGACGAALPAIVSLPDASSAVVAWYGTSIASRSDPIAACAAAAAAPLQVAVVSQAATATPTVGTITTLATDGISIRPPALALDGSTALLAAPRAADVAVWSLSSTGTVASLSAIASLAGARAVAMAGDGAGNLAVVAEIGCAPQSIAITFGTVAGGFSAATPVVEANGDLQVQPSVAWIDATDRTPGRWIVTWISAQGGAHVLARSFDASGKALDTAIDPSTSVVGAAVSNSADALGYAAASNRFVSTSLGCTP